jgi:hypothetical protein
MALEHRKIPKICCFRQKFAVSVNFFFVFALAAHIEMIFGIQIYHKNI